MTLGRTLPGRPVRLAELCLLILALATGISSYAIVGMTLNSSLPANFWFETAALIALGLFFHVVLSIFAPWSDQVLLPTVILLNATGLAMIMRIELAGVRAANVVRSTWWSLLSALVAAALIVLIRDHKLLRRFSYISMVVGLALLLLPLVPGLGVTINGSPRWISLFGFTMQPGEFGKIFLGIFFAGYLVTARDNLALAGPKVLGLQLPRARDLGPIAVVWAVSIGLLVLQTDLGMSLMIFGMFVAMLYLATQRVSWLVIGGTAFAGGALLAVRTFSHVASRIDGWLNAMDPAVFNRVGGSFQLVSGLFGLANGGLLGTGWGRGFPQIVPLSFSDFIFTSLGEELGLTGLLAIMVLFLIICERGLRTAVGVRDGFGKLLAGGLSFMMALQLFTIIGGVTRMLPLTGTTVPFMAQGGTSMLSSWMVIGLLLRISNDARRPSASPGVAQVARPPKAAHVVPGRDHSAPPSSVTPELGATAGPATEFLTPLPAGASLQSTAVAR